MWWYMYLKNALKYAAGCTSAAAASLNGAVATNRACIFNYHRVAHVRNLGCAFDNWNVDPETFELQARWLASKAECVPLEMLMDRIQSNGRSKPLVALSFDDGTPILGTMFCLSSNGMVFQRRYLWLHNTWDHHRPFRLTPGARRSAPEPPPWPGGPSLGPSLKNVSARV